MARPTSTFYRWCTTTANRIAASASARISGFAAGDPVPSGVHNDLMGFLSDWTEWLGTRPATLVLDALNYAPWTDLGVSGSVVDVARDISGTVTLTFGSGSTGYAGFLLPIEGGLLTDVDIDVSAIDVTTGGAGQVTVEVSLVETDGTAGGALYSGPVTVTGVTAIPVVGSAGTTSTRDALLYVAIRPGTQTAHTVTISSLTLTFDPVP